MPRSQQGFASAHLRAVAELDLTAEEMDPSGLDTLYISSERQVIKLIVNDYHQSDGQIVCHVIVVEGWWWFVMPSQSENQVVEPYVSAWCFRVHPTDLVGYLV